MSYVFSACNDRYLDLEPVMNSSMMDFLLWTAHKLDLDKVKEKMIEESKNQKPN